MNRECDTALTMSPETASGVKMLRKIIRYPEITSLIEKRSNMLKKY